jgi:hypothetical protein
VIARGICFVTLSAQSRGAHAPGAKYAGCAAGIFIVLMLARVLRALFDAVVHRDAGTARDRTA